MDAFRCTGKLCLCDVSSGITGEGTPAALSYEQYMNPNVMGSFQPSLAVLLRSQQMAWPRLPLQAGERGLCLEQLRILLTGFGGVWFFFCFCFLFNLVWFGLVWFLGLLFLFVHSKF